MYMNLVWGLSMYDQLNDKFIRMGNDIVELWMKYDMTLMNVHAWLVVKLIEYDLIILDGCIIDWVIKVHGMWYRYMTRRFCWGICVVMKLLK